MTQWTLPYTNPFQAIKAAALMRGKPEDFQRALAVFAESAEWSNFDRCEYLDDLLEEIAGRTNIVVQYIDNGNSVSEYRAAYDSETHEETPYDPLPRNYVHCPNCGKQHFRVTITQTADVKFKEDDHEVTDGPYGDLEWDENSTAVCATNLGGCGWSGQLKELT